MGLSIGDYGVHAVEVEWTGQTPTLRAIDEWQHSLPMGEETTHAEGLSEFREYLAAFTVGDQLLWGAAEPLRRMLRILVARIAR